MLPLRLRILSPPQGALKDSPERATLAYVLLVPNPPPSSIATFLFFPLGMGRTSSPFYVSCMDTSRIPAWHGASSVRRYDLSQRASLPFFPELRVFRRGQKECFQLALDGVSVLGHFYPGLWKWTPFHFPPPYSEVSYDFTTTVSLMR